VIYKKYAEVAERNLFSAEVFPVFLWRILFIVSVKQPSPHGEKHDFGKRQCT